MADLQFNEEQQVYSRYGSVGQPSFLARLVLATGIVETEADAQKVLLIIGVLCLIAMTYVIFTGFSKTAPLKNPYAIGEDGFGPPKGLTTASY